VPCRPEASNPFRDPGLVERYEAWYEGPGRRADRLEKALLHRLLEGFDDARKLLDVGSGTGHFGRHFARAGRLVVGLDISPPMVREAARHGGPPSILGDASRLPFDDRSFDVVAIVATLAFVSNPRQVLAEAARVSRSGLLIGALNGTSRLGRRIRRTADQPWRSARPLTVSELRRLVAAVCGDLEPSVRWFTTLWPGLSWALRAPWGGFIGMAVSWETRSRKVQQR
jgi:SAM-dependent methyltransferase